MTLSKVNFLNGVLKEYRSKLDAIWNYVYDLRSHKSLNGQIGANAKAFQQLQNEFLNIESTLAEIRLKINSFQEKPPKEQFADRNQCSALVENFTSTEKSAQALIARAKSLLDQRRY